MTAHRLGDRIRVLDALAEHGLDIPTDMSVAGYDNTPVAALRTVSLTTVDQFATETGAEATSVAGGPGR